jgi:hypothetical protein
LQKAASRLASPTFLEREAATRQLAVAGMAAVSHVEAATRSLDAEARNRALRILATWQLAQEPQLAAAADRILLQISGKGGSSGVIVDSLLANAQLRREIEFVAELDRKAPLANLVLM